MSASHKMAKSLLKENLRYFWILLAFSSVMMLLVLGVQMAEGLPLEIDRYNQVFALSLIAIPLFGVNII